MERYENLGLVGEGSYGMVMKCRHKETNQLVAIKKFIESEDDKMVKKIALREIRMLKQLHHSNLVNLLEVFRRKKRLFLVFEFVDRTVLDDLDKAPNGLDEVQVKKISYQVLRGLDFCHTHNIIHRDVKPENILVSKSGIVKLCDFGFARPLAIGPGEVFTDYVATRWYRAPELLVGDTNYGKAVDIWAVGCLLSEMLTGEPLFPGDSDIDQLFHITKCLGNLTARHREIFHRNPLFMGMRIPEVKEAESLEKRYPRIFPDAMNIIKKSLELDGNNRLTCQQMMKHEFYTRNNFAEKFLVELKNRIEKETAENPLLRALATRRESSEDKAKRDRDREKEKEKEKERDRERREKKHRKDSDLRKRKDVPTKTPSNHSLAKSSSSPDSKIGHTTSSVENIHHQKHSGPLGNIHLSPIHDPDQHKENSLDNLLLNRSDTKMSSRTALGLNISTPGGDLPLPSSQGHRSVDPKLKKITNVPHPKKQSSDINGQLISDKTLHQEQRSNISDVDKYSRSLADETFSERFKKKSMKQDSKEYLHKDPRSDVEFPPVAGLTFPSVKGAEGKQHSKQKHSKPNKKQYFSTMPHIANIDPFQSNFRESPVDGRITNHRDRETKDVKNLPAV